MKPLPFFLSLLIITLFTFKAFSQNDQIPRDHVLMEVFAGTECCHLQGVELALKSIVKYQDPILVVRHDFCVCSDGIFENEHTIGRSLFYEADGFPDAYFNGTENYTGGGEASVYDEYEYLFTPMINEPTNYLLEMDIEEITSGSYIAHIIATKLNPSDSRQIFTLQLAATVPEIDNTWFPSGVDHIFRFVQLGMFPDYQGTEIDFSIQNQLAIDIPFTADSAMTGKLLHMIAFLQDNESKAIVQDVMAPVAVYQYPIDVAINKLTNIPTGLCHSEIMPVKVIMIFFILTSTNMDAPLLPPKRCT